MALVAGIDTSTQSCKVVIRDAESGALIRSGRAPHPVGTEVPPSAWWSALTTAIQDAGGLGDVAAVAVGGQQHGMVCLDENGQVLRDALLWNDTRSAAAAADLVREWGAQRWAEATGLVPVASFTVSKLRWLADHEPDIAARVAAVCLPHDYITARLRGPRTSGTPDAISIDELTTDRSDASGTGYFSPATNQYRYDLVERALGHRPALPQVLSPSDSAGTAADGASALLGPGAGDNAAAALGVGARDGDVIVSIGTSGVVCAVTTTLPAPDVTGTVAGFASATGGFLPLIATLNASRVLDAVGKILNVDHRSIARLALSAPAGAGGLTLVPYLEGERTPNRPDATGAFHGLRLANSTPEMFARAAIEGMLCGLADGLDAILAQGVAAERIILIGGGAQSEAVRQLAPAIFARPVIVPAPGEYVADGAARQAAWVLTGELPEWEQAASITLTAPPTPHVRQQYHHVRDLTAQR